MKYFNDLQSLFKDILHKYENAESTCIGEFSMNMKKDYKELEIEIEEYKQEFDRLYDQELNKDVERE